LDYTDWFSGRVAELREQRGVSARDMSLSLGQSESYINKIENRRTMPSMTGFFYICEYFGITPAQFFDTMSANPVLEKELREKLARLTAEQMDHVLQIIEDLAKCAT